MLLFKHDVILKWDVVFIYWQLDKGVDLRKILLSFYCYEQCNLIGNGNVRSCYSNIIPAGCFNVTTLQFNECKVMLLNKSSYDEMGEL
jgi:hypothetical protein